MRVSVLWGGGIRAGFVEEVTFGLDFEAQAGFHWFENQGGDLSGQEGVTRKQVEKTRNT